jgi:hypothetical protein
MSLEKRTHLWVKLWSYGEKRDARTVSPGCSVVQEGTWFTTGRGFPVEACLLYWDPTCGYILRLPADRELYQGLMSRKVDATKEAWAVLPDGSCLLVLGQTADGTIFRPHDELQVDFDLSTEPDWNKVFNA